MLQCRQFLVRLRAGDTTREIACSGLMGRDKAGELRTLALSPGWLGPTAERPDDQAIAIALKPVRRASSTVSSVEPFRQMVPPWVQAGVQSRAIHAALRREHGFGGSLPGCRAHGGLAARSATARGHGAPPLRAGRGRTGRLRRAGADASGRQTAAALGLRHGAVPQPSPLSRVRLGSEFGRLARLSSPGLRMVPAVPISAQSIEALPEAPARSLGDALIERIASPRRKERLQLHPVLGRDELAERPAVLRQEPGRSAYLGPPRRRLSPDCVFSRPH